MEKQILNCDVKSDWVDYNAHMNDTEYARVFSMAVDCLMDEIGIDNTFRDEHAYSIFTLETHICYLAEAYEGEQLTVTLQVLDHDQKRIHLFFTMKNKAGKRLATSEQMLMGMDMKMGKPAVFPEQVKQSIEQIAKQQINMPYPEQAGRKIGIRRK